MSRDFRGLLKLAFGPPRTVGEFMRAWNSDLGANPSLRRSAFDKINAAGLDVNSPASRIPYVLGGGVIGRAAAAYLGAGSFLKNVATVGGALVGNSLYNRAHPGPLARPYAPGVVYRGF